MKHKKPTTISKNIGLNDDPERVFIDQQPDALSLTEPHRVQNHLCDLSVLKRFPTMGRAGENKIIKAGPLAKLVV